MDNATRLMVFQAQTRNVRALGQASRQVNRTINNALRKGDYKTTQVYTKVFALIYCAWSEAIFSKMIHTPYGFELEEIEQIKLIHKKHGIGEAWKKSLELGLRHIQNRGKSNYIPNVKQKVTSIIEQYIVSPSLVRNKIAHGQWEVALNKENSRTNQDLTLEISCLNVVTITTWFEVNKRLSQIIEALIESPNRAFHRDYWSLVSEIEDYLNKTATWNLSDKAKRLARKPVRPQ